MPPPNEPRTLFVYYKVPSEDRGAALAAVATLREQIAAALPDIHLECMQRPGIANGVETWMETSESQRKGPSGLRLLCRRSRRWPGGPGPERFLFP